MEEQMKPILTSMAAGSLLAALAIAQTPRYTVTDLGTLGGTSGSANGINYEGRVAGAASLPNGNSRAFLSGPGAIYDLGTLGGPNSSEGGLNAAYQMAIYAETSKTDPLNENFCGFGTSNICLAANWNGTMTALPTLGGNNAIAYAINNQGQVAGAAETSTKDPTCVPPQVLQFEAALWGPTGQVQELPPLPGDTVGAALWLNNYGQAVGSSGTCASGGVAPAFDGTHAVLWQNGLPANLGNLGGSIVALGQSINDLGEVVGCADLASEVPGFPFIQLHAFLWTQAAGMQDIGTVGTDFSSLPFGINDNGQAVGASCDDMGNCRAFVWQNEAMMDLNALIPANSPLYLAFAFAINDAGEIAGQAMDKSTGEMHAFVATPEPAAAGVKDFEPASPDLSRPMVLPESVRRQIQQRLGFGRIGARRNGSR
jgi:probable HAF family extracellular repeat protein